MDRRTDGRTEDIATLYASPAASLFVKYSFIDVFFIITVVCCINYFVRYCPRGSLCDSCVTSVYTSNAVWDVYIHFKSELD